MKKNIQFIFVMFCLCLGLATCADLDDVKDTSNYSPDEVWKDVKLANAYLADLYRRSLPGSWPRNGGYADISSGTIPKDWMTVDNGRWFTWNYSSIRRINMLFQDIEDGSLRESDKKDIKAQAYFLRAWQYFKMVRIHGGVPIIKNVQKPTDDLKVTRASTNDTFTFIIEDLDKAIADLPDKRPAAEFGRIDKAIAKAFKGRVLLTEASPMFGPDAARYWPDAYTATKEAKEFADAQGFGLLAEYEKVFTTDGHKEAIFAIVSNDDRRNLRAEHCVRPHSESENCTGQDAPIWSLVESYPMKDGKKITDSSSKYTYNMQRFWENRDPRFDYTIVYNGKPYPLAAKAGRRQYTDINAVQRDRFTNRGGSATGLYCNKGLEISNDKANAEQNTQDWIEIRYAEVLLNYAEAANEMDKIEEAKTALRAIRKRAGIEAGSGDYGMDLSSKASVRQTIRDERKIEFAFEGLRLWDLRRWRIWHTTVPTTKYGLKSELKSGKTDNDENRNKYVFQSEDFTYTKDALGGTNVILEKYYFVPIRQSHMDLNSKLEQNKEWGGKFDPRLN